MERSLDRSTLLKAAQQGHIPARKSGDIWLVDDESELFKFWLAGAKTGRPRKSQSLYASHRVARSPHDEHYGN